jgi:hypothetical protein
MMGTPVRIDDEVYAAARRVGATASRSAAQQVDYWVRMGRAVSMAEAGVRSRIDDAIAGRKPFSDLTAEERLLANAEIDAAIEQSAVSSDYADRLAAEGITTVVMDEYGRLVTRHPDGTSTPV